MDHAAGGKSLPIPAERRDAAMGFGQAVAITGVGTQVDRCGAQPAQRFALAADGGVLRAPTDPHDTRLVLLDHPAAPGHADAARSADHHIDPASPVRAIASRQVLHGDQLARQPTAIAPGPGIAFGVEGDREHCAKRPGPGGLQVEQADLPRAVLLGHGADETMDARMRRDHPVAGAGRVRLLREQRPRQVLGPVAGGQQHLDVAIQRQHALLLGRQDRLPAGLRTRGACGVEGSRCDPDDVVHRLAARQGTGQGRLGLRPLAVGRIVAELTGREQALDGLLLLSGPAQHQHAGAVCAAVLQRQGRVLRGRDLLRIPEN